MFQTKTFQSAAFQKVEFRSAVMWPHIISQGLDIVSMNDALIFPDI